MFIPLDVLIHQNNDKALGGSGELQRGSWILLLQTHGWERNSRRTPTETDVNDAVLNCSSLPGAAESCPRPGLYDLKAHS